MRPGRSCYAYPQPSSLPTGRLDSPSGLDKTRLTIPGQSPLPVKLSSASLTGNSSSPWSLPKHSPLVGKIRQDAWF